MSKKWFEKNTGNKNGIPTGGVGYVAMPDDESNISDYVQQCYRSNEITIAGDGFGVISHVKVVDGIMQHLRFPDDEDGKGSMVVWVRESFYNRPIVVGTLTNNDTAVIINPGQSREVQEYGGVSIGTFTDAMNGILNLLAVGNENRPVKIILKATGSEDDEVEINASKEIRHVSRTFSVEATEDFKVEINNGEQPIITIEGNLDKLHFSDFRGNDFEINNYESSEDPDYKGDEEIKKYIKFKDAFGREYTFDEEKAELKDQFGHVATFDNDKAELVDQFEHKVVFNEDEAHYTDKFGNEAIANGDNIQFKCKKFNVGNGNEHMVLGDTLKGLLEQLISAITSITVPTPHGSSGTPLNSAQFNQIKSQLSKILSQLSNTD